MNNKTRQTLAVLSVVIAITALILTPRPQRKNQKDSIKEDVLPVYTESELTPPPKPENSFLIKSTYEEAIELTSIQLTTPGFIVCTDKDYSQVYCESEILVGFIGQKTIPVKERKVGDGLIVALFIDDGDKLFDIKSDKLYTEAKVKIGEKAESQFISPYGL